MIQLSPELAYRLKNLMDMVKAVNSDSNFVLLNCRIERVVRHQRHMYIHVFVLPNVFKFMYAHVYVNKYIRIIIVYVCISTIGKKHFKQMSPKRNGIRCLLTLQN